MATTRKRKTTRRPARRAKRTRRTTMSAAPRRKRRTTKRKKKGFLSEIVSPAQAKASGRNIVGGAVGGVGALLVEQFLGDMPEKNKAIWTAAIAFGFSAVLDMPNVGAGMAGVAGYKFAAQTGLAEGEDEFEDFEYIDDLEQLPPFMSEDGNPMLLANDDMDLAASPYDLSQGYGVGYYRDDQGWGNI